MSQSKNLGYYLCIIGLFSLKVAISSAAPKESENSLSSLFDLDYDDDHDWNYLLYSQRWPVTGCIEWKEEKEGNTCLFPKDRTTWTVHGIWPTKSGTEGPNNCKSAIHFDPEQLVPFKDQLDNYWTNVEANTKPYSFWKHEWDKHGTCASVLPQMNSVYNYFKKGLDWNRQYDLATILSEAQIVPSKDGYSVDHIFYSVQKALNATPTVQCVVDHDTKENLISEIRICFNRDLEVINCNTVMEKPEDQIMSNCDLKKPVMYLSTDSKRDNDKASFYAEYSKRREKYIGLYKFMKFLIWYTL